MSEESPPSAREPKARDAPTNRSDATSDASTTPAPDETTGGESTTPAPDATSEESAEPTSEPLWRNVDFRRFFAGQFVTNVGDSLYSVAVLWLVFDLSGSSTLVGLANAGLLLPYLLQIVAGPVVDRFAADRLLVGTQLVQGIVVLVFPLAAVAGQLSVGLVLVTIPVLALATTASGPLRAAVVPRIVPEDRLSEGNSALATVTLGLDMLFDAVSGFVIAATGATVLFLADAATFAVAATLFAATTIPRVASDVDGDDEVGAGTNTTDANTADTNPTATDDATGPLSSYLADLRAAVEILRGSTFVTLIGLNAVFNLAVGVTLATLPAFGASLAGPTVAGIALAGPAAYGATLGALGIGRLVGSVLAPRLDGVPYGPLRAGTALAATLAWLVAALAPSVLVTLVSFGVAWVAAGLAGVLTSTINQRVFPSAVLGRISAIKGTASTATLPLGSLLGGVAADVLGPRTTMAITALGFGVVGVTFTLRPALRRLPPVSRVEPADFRLSFDVESATDE